MIVPVVSAQLPQRLASCCRVYADAEGMDEAEAVMSGNRLKKGRGGAYEVECEHASNRGMFCSVVPMMLYDELQVRGSQPSR